MREARLERLLHRGLTAQQRGDQAGAERCYQAFLTLAPMDANANHLLGVLRCQQGRHTEALPLLETALAAAPQSAEIQAHYGLALHGAGRHAEALAILDSALALAADRFALQAETLNSRGMVLMALQRAAEALASLEKAVTLEPSYAEAWNNRGIALRGMDRMTDASESFARAAALAPGHPGVLFNLGLACRATGDLDQALAAFERILESYPDHRPTHSNLAQLLCERGRTDEALAHFRRHAELGGGDSGAQSDHKHRHDQEQAAWLANAGWQDGAGARLPVAAVNARNDVAAIAQAWRTARPQVAVIDNLLTQEALQSLRRFCWQAPIWRKSYPEGYLGAVPEEGFAAPLLSQIAAELRQTYDAIFGDHCLRYLWAFKCDSRLRGVNIHADFAAVNVNFWITPDEANCNPDSGGLVIWDKAAPLDWDFTRYNQDQAAIRAFLKDSGARSQTVPYRANRAVIFDSDLFHQTDDISFRDGYTNRRINVTMLYGRRRSHEG